MTEAMKYLEEESIPTRIGFPPDNSPFEHACYFEDHSAKHCIFDVFYNTADITDAPVVFVGGYEVDAINLYAIAGTSDNVVLNTSMDESILYRCCYIFHCWNNDKEEIQTTFDDLTRKLTVLYGEGIPESNGKDIGEHGYWPFEDTVTWFGADNTAVVLTYSYISENITIDYWDTGCCKEFQAVINIQTNEYNAALDTSGL